MTRINRRSFLKGATAVGVVASSFGLPAFLCHAQATGEGLKKCQIGNVEVWAIADSTAGLDTARMFASTNQDLIKKYVPSGNAPGGFTVFLIKMGNELILVDTGYGTPPGPQGSQLLPGLNKLSIAPAAITKVLLTHMHGDHIGGLLSEGNKAFPNAKILVGRIEYDFWMNEASVQAFPERKGNFDLARKIVSMYGNAVECFDFGATVLPGIQAQDLRGHTPGQAGFLLQSGSDKLFFWGDVLHAAALQFPRPEINPVFDMDPSAAVALRARILEMTAKDKLLIAGAHLPFPPVGKVEKADEGYRFVSG